MGQNGKFHKFKLSLFRSTSKPPPPSQPPPPPPEYVCAVCQELITEPVVVASGHTFDRTCVQVCIDLEFTPNLPDGTCADFSTVIPNLALRTAIPKWCSENGVVFPASKKYADVEEKIRVNGLIDEVMKDKGDPNEFLGLSELTRKVNRFESTSSDESVIVEQSPLTPLPFTTRPSCWSRNSSSSEFTTSGEIVNPNSTNLGGNDDEEAIFLAKFESNDPYEQEHAAVSLRKLTRNDVNSRLRLCTPKLLIAIQSLLISSYEKVQVNAIAALVNLSLENENKVKIVRSGIVPTVIDLLKVRLSETQEHATGVIFSLSLSEHNRTAIGVLGALPPLINCLTRSDSDRTRCDSALALYNLAFDHSNRVKLVKLGFVPLLVAVLRSGNEAVSGIVLLILYQLAASAAGKAVMLDANAVAQLVAILRSTESLTESTQSTRENCIAVLYALSYESLRFKVLAREAKAVEVLNAVVEKGSERASEKARRILVTLKDKNEIESDESSEFDWEAILESTGSELSRLQVGSSRVQVAKSSEY